MKITSREAVRTAFSQVGYKAEKGKKNKYAAWIDSHYPTFYNGKKNGADWCDVFVDFCVLWNTKNAKDAEHILCQPAKSCGAGCKYSYQYYKSKHRNTSIGHYGDQIFLNVKQKDGSYKKCAHTGIVYKVDNKYVYYVAGNEGGGNGEVKKHKLLKTSKNIYAYGRPKYTDTV